MPESSKYEEEKIVVSKEENKVGEMTNSTKREKFKSLDELTGLNSLMAGKKGPISYLKSYQNVLLHDRDIITDGDEL